MNLHKCRLTITSTNSNQIFNFCGTLKNFLAKIGSLPCPFPCQINMDTSMNRHTIPYTLWFAWPIRLDGSWLDWATVKTTERRQYFTPTIGDIYLPNNNLFFVFMLFDKIRRLIETSRHTHIFISLLATMWWYFIIDYVGIFFAKKLMPVTIRVNRIPHFV